MIRVPQRVPVVLWFGVVSAALLLPGGAQAACIDDTTKTDTLMNGCKAQYVCVAGDWEGGDCTAGTTTVACTGCGGRSGTVVCDAGCSVTGCSVGQEVCNNCDDDADSYIDNAPGNYANTLTESCNPNACTTGGTRTCSAGVWSSCSGCGGTAACTGCENRSGSAVCDASCSKGACNVGAETCNNCDDNGDGRIDNASGSLKPNTLEQACNPNGCSMGGVQTCLPGGWGSCSGCSGVAMCTTSTCGMTATGSCNAQCEPPTACMTSEVCNQCDDDGNGLVDDGIECNGALCN